MVNTCTRVSLRQRAIKNDRISLYLDFYPPVRNPETMQMSRREYLGIYIYAHPKNEMERELIQICSTKQRPSVVSEPNHSSMKNLVFWTKHDRKLIFWHTLRR